jgi:hypothetical protein
MSEDFHAELEDGSPLEVARSLIALWHECLTGASPMLERLRAAAAAAGGANGARASTRQTVRAAAAADAVDTPPPLAGRHRVCTLCGCLNAVPLSLAAAGGPRRHADGGRQQQQRQWLRRR